jgi:hypothetical protein
MPPTGSSRTLGPPSSEAGEHQGRPKNPGALLSTQDKQAGSGSAARSKLGRFARNSIIKEGSHRSRCCR